MTKEKKNKERTEREREREREIEGVGLSQKPQKNSAFTLAMRLPGVEPGAQAWEACMLPLHYRRL